MPDQICFPDHIGLPFQPDPPTVDGYVEPEPAMVWAFGTAPAQVDVGWRGSSKQTFGNAASAYLSSPLVVYQGVKHNADDYIYLSFVIRRDSDFDDEDRIILVFHPSFAAGSASKTGAERRIDIEPLQAGLGGSGALTFDEPDPWGIAGGSSGGFKTNRLPQNVEYYRWDTGLGTWDALSADPTNVEIKIRSWDGGANNKNWSVEVKIPTTIADGGSNWIDFTSNFGFYFNVIRSSQGAGGLDPSFVTQFPWPPGTELDDNGGLLDINQIEIEPAKLGEAILGSGPACSGVSGVKFNGGSAAIGARVVGSTAAPSSSIEKFQPNEFVARILNDDTTRSADNITAEFRIANWGIGPGTFPKWNLIPADAGQSNPSLPQSLAAAGGSPTTAELTTQWTLDATEQGLYGTTISNHQCIWVILSSNQSVSFAESSMKRNMNIVPLSDYEQDAEISGEGWPKDDAGGDVEFILLTSQIAVARHLDRQLDLASTDEMPIDVPTDLMEMDSIVKPGETEVQQAFVTVVDAYRRTGRTLTIHGRQLPVYDLGDSFGHIGIHHDTEEADLDFELVGGGLTNVAPGRYRIQVPRGGSSKITARLATRKRGGGGEAKWIELLLRLLRALLRWLKSLAKALWRLIRKLFGGS